jgi:glycosyltransferase involved in cell wall biosynthesis
MASLDVVILTFNEEIHVARAMSSVRNIADNIFIIDSGSTDRTVQIAVENGAVIFTNPFITQAKQMNWALNNVPFKSNWIMRLDADEVISEELSAEISGILGQLPPTVNGINLKRKHIFMDRWIRHGGRYPLILLRIWRNGKAHCEDRWMDEHMVIDSGMTTTLRHSFADINLQDLSFFTAKHNSYATREAVDVLNVKYRLNLVAPIGRTENLSAQARLKRIIKDRLYNGTSIWFGPLGYFMFRYIIQGGFLDGKAGLIYHFLQGFWYRFLVAAKITEFDLVLSKCADKTEQRLELQRLTGINFSKYVVDSDTNSV